MFSDFILASMTQATFVETTLVGGVGGLAILANAGADSDEKSYTAVDAVAVDGTDFAVPVFETGLVDEVSTGSGPDSRRESRARRHRMGGVTWLDAISRLRLTAQMAALAGPVVSVGEQSLFDRLGDQADLAALETALGALVPPDQAAAVLDRLGIASIGDYRSGRHRIADISAGPLAATTTAEIVPVDLLVSVFEGDTWCEHLRTAARTRAVMRREAALDPTVSGRRRDVVAAHLAVLPDSILVASPLPGHDVAASRTALAALFWSAGYLVHFEPDP
ncbi:hypothetical protein [Marinibacterium sp. SX1]|uniref:hypothetical protein n=1 Tax=Marinibacterium sp. SX1 TaxID=3388424 RepID=UPI003D175AB9